MHGVPCSSATAKSLERAPKVGFVRRSISDGDYQTELKHVVGPIISRDTQILEQYLPPADESIDDPSSLRATGPQPPHKAVYHATVPQRRPSPPECVCSRNLCTELCDRVELFADKLVALYFDQLHPCFPVVDEDCVKRKMTDGLLPPHYAANLYAYSLFYADMSPELSAYVQPE